MPLVAVPGRERPMAVTIIRDTEDFNGIEVLLGPDGFQRLAQLHDPDATDSQIEGYSSGNYLSVMFVPASQIHWDYKKVWKAGW